QRAASQGLETRTERAATIRELGNPRSLTVAARLLQHHSIEGPLETSMRILLTNDDGVYAPGLRALLPELRKLGEVTVVAPAGEQSAVGHSVTLMTPLIVQEVLDDRQAFL